MPNRTTTFLVLASLAGLPLVGCGQTDTIGDAPSVRVEGVRTAEVNGEPIFLSDLELEAVAQGLISAGDAFPPEHPDFQMVLDQLIDQRLLAQESLRRGLDRREGARHRLNAARERILGNILVESLVASDVTEEAIREMYAEQVRLQQLDDEVRISLITVPDKETAETVRAEYDAEVEFSALAFKYSTDASTRIEGGDLGYISPADQPEPFASTIANTPEGSISEAFESDAGWHIMRVVDRRQRAPKTLEEMRPEIVTFLTYSQINDILRRLRTAAEIKTDIPGKSAPPPSNDDPSSDTPDRAL
ncbi:MAG: peptidylprolyl isomerase [Pseudomonadota bacterium]